MSNTKIGYPFLSDEIAHAINQDGNESGTAYVGGSYSRIGVRSLDEPHRVYLCRGSRQIPIDVTFAGINASRCIDDDGTHHIKARGVITWERAEDDPGTVTEIEAAEAFGVPV